MGVRATYAVAPSAARLTGSLRDVGYDAPSAVADLVDNSIAAGAGRVEVIFESDGDPRVLVADDGSGLSPQRANEALRFGSRRSYGEGDLGRYGLGLKTASLSQCRRVTVVSRRPGRSLLTVRQLDLDLIAEFDEWLVVHPGQTPAVQRAVDLLEEQFSTVVVWEQLDRLLPGRRDTAYARRRMETWTDRIRQHLAMVFHRYLSGSAPVRVDISVNGEKLRAWDPFLRAEAGTRELPAQTFELEHGAVTGRVSLRRWVLPPRDSFDRPADFERAGGPLKWNRQQGLYIYRADRLVQWGGWAGLRAIDEHTKLARCALSFGTDLDEAFNINVAKMRVGLPSSLKPMLERPVLEVCQAAQNVYRDTTARTVGRAETEPEQTTPVPEGDGQGIAAAGLSLLSAAVQSGRMEALREIVAVLKVQDPGTVRALDLDGI